MPIAPPPSPHTPVSGVFDWWSCCRCCPPPDGRPLTDLLGCCCWWLLQVEDAQRIIQSAGVGQDLEIKVLRRSQEVGEGGDTHAYAHTSRTHTHASPPLPFHHHAHMPLPPWLVMMTCPLSLPVGSGDAARQDGRLHQPLPQGAGHALPAAPQHATQGHPTG